MSDFPDYTVEDIRPFIGSEDFDASRDFYVALGWEVVYDSESLRVLKLGEHRFYLQRYYQKQWCDNTMLHVSVADVDAWFDRVRSVFEQHQFGGKTKVSESLKDEDYGRVFHVLDPSGVLIHFAQFY